MVYLRCREGPATSPEHFRGAHKFDKILFYCFYIMLYVLALQWFEAGVADAPPSPPSQATAFYSHVKHHASASVCLSLPVGVGVLRL